MKTHELKTWPSAFAAAVSGAKRYEIRKDDRNFASGDYLFLKEFDACATCDGEGFYFEPEKLFGVPRTKVTCCAAPHGTFTGRELGVVVTYKTEGGAFGLPDDLCVLSVQPLAEKLTVTRVLFEADCPTPAGRIYPRELLERVVTDATNRVLLGTTDGPEPFDVRLHTASHRIRDLRWDGNRVLATVEVLETEPGRALRALLPSFDVRLVPQGVGRLSAEGRMEEFELQAVNIETEPSLPTVLDENRELRALFDMQASRVQEANERWQQATGRHDTWADLGELVEWLLVQVDEARAQQSTARALMALHSEEQWVRDAIRAMDEAAATARKARAERKDKVRP